MSQDWVPGGTSQGGQGQGAPVWQSPGPQAASVSVSSRWGFAIATILFCWILAIPGFIYASRVKPLLEAGDVAGAQNASKRVLMFFWIAVGIAVLLLIIEVAASSGNSGSG